MQRIERRGSRWACGVCGLVSLVSIASIASIASIGASASAQPSEAGRGRSVREDAEFAAEFSRGLAAEREGAFDRALGHYERALARSTALREPVPRLRALLALGSTHYNLRNFRLSVEYLNRAVADPALPPDRAREARALIDEEMKQLGRLRIDVRPADGESARVDVRVDGRPVSDARALRDLPVEPGAHTVQASAAGFQELVRNVEVGAGQSQTLSEVLVREPVVTANGSATSGTRRAAWIVGSLAALSLAVGIGAGALSWAEHDASECRTGIDCTLDDVDGRKAAITAGNVSTAAWIIGGVGAGVAGYLFWRSGSSDESARPAATQLEVGLARVQLKHAW